MFVTRSGRPDGSVDRHWNPTARNGPLEGGGVCGVGGWGVERLGGE